jgi:acetyl esterase/lipase
MTHSRPVVVFYAGGGWVTGNLDTEDHLCRTICGRADVVVVSVDYRKFPAIQFPENIQDSYDGFQWVRSFLAGRLAVRLYIDCTPG